MSYESLIWDSETELAKRYEKLQDELIPSMGNCDTIEGETLRAFSKLGYRYFNDGDFFYEGYGCETAGSAHAFLVDDSPIADVLRPIFKECEFKGEDVYMQAIDQAAEIIISWIESKNGKLTPNTNGINMLKSKPHFEWEDEPDDNDDYDDYLADDDHDDPRLSSY